MRLQFGKSKAVIYLKMWSTASKLCVKRQYLAVHKLSFISATDTKTATVSRANLTARIGIFGCAPHRGSLSVSSG